MRIKVELSGFDKLRGKLGKDAADDLVDAIELDLANETRKMAVQGAKNAPVETGALRASVLASPQRAGKLTYYWGSKLPYALRQEYEHKTKRAYLRRAYWQGQKELQKTIRFTLKRRLGG